MMLLIYPPFAMPDKPYISLPTLAAFLQEQNLSVTLWDANLSFFRHALNPDNLKKSGQAATLLNLFDSGAPGEKAPEAPSLGNRERMALFGQYLEQVRSPGESLSITGNTGYLRYRTPVSMFDSRAMIAFARESRSLTRDVLAGSLDSRLTAADPVLVGISVAFPDQILPALTLAAMIKEKNADIPVVLGGPFVSMHLSEIQNPAFFSLVDYLVLGDGEAVLPDLYHRLWIYQKRKNGTPVPDNIPDGILGGISGVVYRDHKGEIHRAAPQIHPMAQASAPAYDLLPLDDYLVPRSTRAVLFRLSRGCYWGRCAFCNSLSPVIHLHDQAGFAKTYEDLIATLDQARSPIIHFTDDAAPPDMLAYLAERLIADERKVSWTVNVRVDKRLTLPLLSLLHTAGCFSLFLGVESCCDRILQKMNKGTHLERIERLITDLSWTGISANIYMIVGFPTETEEEARASFDQVSKWADEGLVRQVIYNVFAVTPASPVAAAPRDFGITDLHVPEERDLKPPLSGFACETGMTRQQAATLCAEFSASLKRRE